MKIIWFISDEFAKFSAGLLAVFCLTSVLPALNADQTANVLIVACDMLNLLYECSHTP